MTTPGSLMPPFGGVGGARRGIPFTGSQPLQFAHITDIHLSTQRRCLPADLRDDLQRIVGENDLDFIIASGDLTAGGKPEEFAAFREVIDALPVPLYPAAGNHDDDSGVDAVAYLQYLGPLHYSTDLSPSLHLAVFDGEGWQREGLSAGDNREAFPWIPSCVDDWLADDLARQPADRAILLVNHYPWGEAMYRRVQHHRIVAVLSGHWHSSRRCLDSAGIVHYATPSLCFGGIDQTPRGYRTFSYATGELTSQSRDLSPRMQWPGRESTPTSAATDADSDSTWHEAWRAPTGGRIHTAPLRLHRGRLIQTTWDDDGGTGAGVTALDAATGRICWRHHTTASIRNGAACDAGRVVVLTMTGQFICLDLATGRVLWSFDLREPTQRWVYSAPLIVDDLVIGGVSSHLVALDVDTGQLRWARHDLGCEDWISSYPSPASDAQHVAVAFYSQATSLAVLDLVTGETVWQSDGAKRNYVYSTPLIADDSLYVVSGSVVRALDVATGRLQWECPVSLQRIQATPALVEDRLIVSTGQGHVHAIDRSSGQICWTWQVETQFPLFTPYLRTGPTTLGSPVVHGDRVRVPAADGNLYGLCVASGALVEQLSLGRPLAAPPVVVDDRLWVGRSDGVVVQLIRDTRSCDHKHG